MQAERGGHRAVARDSRDLRLRKGVANGSYEPAASARHRDAVHDGWRGAFIHQLAAGQGIIRLGGNIAGLVPPSVEVRLRKKIQFAATVAHAFTIGNMSTELKPTLAERIASISVSSTMKVAARMRKAAVARRRCGGFRCWRADFPTPDNVKQAAVRAIEQNFTKYTVSRRGTLRVEAGRLRAARERFGTAYKPSECIISVGGSTSYSTWCRHIINSRRRVIIPVPYWVTYKDV